MGILEIEGRGRAAIISLREAFKFDLELGWFLTLKQDTLVVDVAAEANSLNRPSMKL